MEFSSIGRLADGAYFNVKTWFYIEMCIKAIFSKGIDYNSLLTAFVVCVFKITILCL